MEKNNKPSEKLDGQDYYGYGKKKNTPYKNTPTKKIKVKGERTTRKRALERVCKAVIAGDAGEVLRSKTVPAMDNNDEHKNTAGFNGYAESILNFLDDYPTLGSLGDIHTRFKKPSLITNAALTFLKQRGDIFVTDSGFIITKTVLTNIILVMKNNCEKKGFVEISDLRYEYGARFSRKMMLLVLDLIDEAGCFQNKDNKRYLRQDTGEDNPAKGVDDAAAP